MDRFEQQALEDALKDPEFTQGLLGETESPARPYTSAEVDNTANTRYQSALVRLMEGDPHITVEDYFRKVYGIQVVSAHKTFEGDNPDNPLYLFEVFKRGQVDRMSRIIYAEKEGTFLQIENPELIFAYAKVFDRFASEDFSVTLAQIQVLLEEREKKEKQEKNYLYRQEDELKDELRHTA